MRRLIVMSGMAVCLAIVFLQVSAQPLPAWKSSFKNAVFNFSSTVFDFGHIKQNVSVSHKFSFVNKGETPLIISSVQASCGCTVTEYSKDPVAPGGEGFVKATYNAASTGVFNKTVTVNANTAEGMVQLTIKGTVIQ